MTTRDDLSMLRGKPFSEAVEKFEELLVQNGRAFLIGAGCSKCAGLPLTAELTTEVLGSSELDATSKEILAAVSGQFAGAANAHIEDYLSEMIDLLAIGERRDGRGAMKKDITLGSNNYTVAQLRGAADQIKRAIAHVIEKKISMKFIEPLSLQYIAPYA